MTKTIEPPHLIDILDIEKELKGQGNVENNTTNEKNKINIISSLILELDTKTFELNKKLESIIGRMTKEMPKIVKQVQAQKQDILSFLKVINSSNQEVKRQIKKSNTLESLALLDQVLERLKTSQSCIKDADSWGILAAEMESLFAGSNYSKACSRILEAEKSLQMLYEESNGRNLDERKNLLADLKSKFQLILSQAFTKALSDQEFFKEAQPIARHLDAIGCRKEAQIVLLNEFEQEILEKWPVLPIGSFDRKALLAQISFFFESLLNTLNKKCRKVFEAIYEEKSALEMHHLLSLVLSKLQFSKIISLICNDASGSQGRDQSIIHLTQLYSLCVKFGNAFETEFLLELHDLSGKRLHISVDWGAALFTAFVPFQKGFLDLESRYLKSEPLGILIDLMPALENSLARFIQFSMGVSPLAYQKGLDEIVCLKIEQSSAVFQKSVLTRNPSAPDEEFANQIRNLQQLIHFSKGLEKFWETISDERTKSVYRLRCRSSEERFITEGADLNFVITKPSTACLESASKLINAAQRKVLDTLMLPIDNILSKLHGESSWNKITEEDEINFSFSPLSYITLIGEYLLTLPQKFEPFAQEEALSFSLRTLPFSVEEFFKQDKDNGFLFEPTDIWIISAVRLIESRYVAQILKISGLSEFGSKQLVSDCSYLQNIMAAVDIEPLENFRNLINALGLSTEELSNEISSSGSSGDIVEQVAAMRSISVKK